MKRELAENLLAHIMGWSDAEKAEERARLESFAAYKYDQYEQFAPGRRFIESLALWLRQFQPGTERKVAYDFVCNRLIFISNAEMNHLVELAFPTIIRPLILRDVAASLPEIGSQRLVALMQSPIYRARLRQVLVLGLSDGARTDQFRRCNPNFSNEQVFHAYDISSPKAADMSDKLRGDLEKIDGFDLGEEEPSFRYVVLLDDFTASGTSYIREEDGNWTGKIPRILEKLEQSQGLGSTISSSDVRVLIVIYVASIQAANHIQERLPKLEFSKGTVEFQIVHKLEPETPLSDEHDSEILELADREEYFDSNADDEHGEVGGTSKRLGFSNCRLPLVLSHNTPNNSIFLLWAEDVHRILGLFPRVSRHRKFE